MEFKPMTFQGLGQSKNKNNTKREEMFKKHTSGIFCVKLVTETVKSLFFGDGMVT